MDEGMPTPTACRGPSRGGDIIAGRGGEKDEQGQDINTLRKRA